MNDVDAQIQLVRALISRRPHVPDPEFGALAHMNLGQWVESAEHGDARAARLLLRAAILLLMPNPDGAGSSCLPSVLPRELATYLGAALKRIANGRPATSALHLSRNSGSSNALRDDLVVYFVERELFGMKRRNLANAYLRAAVRLNIDDIPPPRPRKSDSEAAFSWTEHNVRAVYQSRMKMRGKYRRANAKNLTPRFRR